MLSSFQLPLQMKSKMSDALNNKWLPALGGTGESTGAGHTWQAAPASHCHRLACSPALQPPGWRPGCQRRGIGCAPDLALTPQLSACVSARCSAEEERRVMGLSYDSLVVRLNSVQHLLDSLGGLERMVVERWGRRGGAGVTGAHSAPMCS